MSHRAAGQNEPSLVMSKAFVALAETDTMAETQLTGERFDHKVAAVFESDAEATKAAAEVRSETTLSDRQVIVARPDDQHQGRELEPENRGIWRTLVRSHIWLAVAGALAGLVLFLVLFVAGIGFVTQNALWAAGVFIFICTLVGGMVGGLVTLRPDHTPYIMAAQSALQSGRYVVTVHAETPDQMHAAKRVLSRSGEVISSL